jgi:nitrogen regulatory protein PII
MKAVKRIEMVLQQDVIEEMAKALDALGISGYTVVRDVLGRGERGLRAGIGLGVFQYHMMVLACEPEQVPSVVAAVRPYLKRFGGMCLVSDAQWVLR